jgi:hypothetical protein
VTPHEHHEAVERHATLDYSHLATHIAWALVAIMAIVFLIWLIMAPVKATAFDADGVRCYNRALQVVCIKTANP